MIDIAARARVRRVALFHHEPTHADADIDCMLDAARTREYQAGGHMQVLAAAEGESIDL